MALLEQQKQFLQLIQQGYPSSRELRGIDECVAPLSGLPIYQNNQICARVSAMQAMYPECEKFLGAAQFTRLCRSYSDNTLQSDGDLNVYGHNLYLYIKGSNYADAYPMLCDLARLEFFKSKAYWAPKRTPFNSECFAGLNSKVQSEQQLSLAPDVGLMSTLFDLNIQHDAEQQQQGGEVRYYIIERVARVAQVDVISLKEYRFLSLLAQNPELEQLCIQAAEDIELLGSQMQRGRIEWSFVEKDYPSP